jgi:transposase
VNNNASNHCPNCAQSQLEIAYLKQELSLLKRMIYGQKRERFMPFGNCGQQQLGLGLEAAEEAEKESETITYHRSKGKPSKTAHNGRNPLPSHLPRNEIIIEPKEKTKDCKPIGEEITEELEYQPGKLFVNRYVRIKYIDTKTEQISIGDLPQRPIEKGIAGPGLLAHVLISKYVDHIPLYRQIKQYKREGITIADSTLNDWVKYSCQLLKPLYERHLKQVLSTDYIMIDETPIRVLDKMKRGKSHSGYFWVYYAPLLKIVYFDYRDNRGRDGPFTILEDYKGNIQTDAYTVYEKLSRKNGCIHLGCFAHARRYFEQSLKADKRRSTWMLEQIGKLYAIERQSRDWQYSFDKIYALRQEESLPVLDKIRDWLDDEMEQVLPRSLIGKAIIYMKGNWERLKRYTEDGRFEIDNNLVENAIRPVALGRKNYLFAGSHNGAGRAALIYSLVGTAKLHQVEPWHYLKDVINRISEHPYSKIDELLPQNWQLTTP